MSIVLYPTYIIKMRSLKFNFLFVVLVPQTSPVVHVHVLAKADTKISQKGVKPL